jgi:hypothetical protein
MRLPVQNPAISAMDCLPYLNSLQNGMLFALGQRFYLLREKKTFEYKMLHWRVGGWLSELPLWELAE